MKECTEMASVCDTDYKAENEAQAKMIALLKYENYSLKMAVKNLTEVIVYCHKDF